MSSTSPTLKSAKAIVWSLWAALIAAPVIYEVVLQKMALSPAHHPNIPPKPLPPPMVFIGLAIFLGFMSLGVRHLFLDRLKSGQIPLDSAVGIKSYTTGHILCFAFSEAVGVLGFMMGLLNPNDHVYQDFLTGALALMLFQIPLLSRVDPRS